MQNYRVNHVHLYSPDPLKTAEFYEKIFGAERRHIQKDPGDRIVVELLLNGTLILISDPWDKNDPNNRFGLDHIGIETDNLDAAIAELKEQGVKFVMDKTSLPVGDISFLIAPDNTLIEVLHLKDRV